MRLTLVFCFQEDWTAPFSVLYCTEIFEPMKQLICVVYVSMTVGHQIGEQLAAHLPSLCVFALAATGASLKWMSVLGNYPQ
jgi:hypothetical protein